MKKLLSKKVLIWTVSIISVLIIGFLVTMNYATDYVLRSIIASSQNTDSASPIVEDNIKETATPIPTSTQETNTSSGSSTDAPSNNTGSSAGQQENLSSVIPITSPLPTTATQTPQPPDKTVVSPTISPTQTMQPVAIATPSPTAQKGYDGNITPDKVADAQESVTLKDKAFISSVLLKKLGASELSLFMKMSGDGVTVEEKRAAKEVILKKLTEDEYNDLIAIAAKLGLSQGKNYQESLKEFDNN